MVKTSSWMKWTRTWELQGTFWDGSDREGVFDLENENKKDKSNFFLIKVECKRYETHTIFFFISFLSPSTKHTLDHSEELFDNGGIDCLFETEDASAGDSQCQGVAAAEVLKSHHPFPWLDCFFYYCYWSIICYIPYNKAMVFCCWAVHLWIFMWLIFFHFSMIL